jgi:hypothetical protein
LRSRLSGPDMSRLFQQLHSIEPSVRGGRISEFADLQSRGMQERSE